MKVPRQLGRCWIAVLLASACAGGATARGPASQGLGDVLVAEQVRQFSDAFQAVQALRPMWLRGRGTDSIRNPSQVWVYMDNSRLGGVGTLRTISTLDIGEIRFYDGLEASQRWGIGHGAGVIALFTRVR